MNKTGKWEKGGELLWVLGVALVALGVSICSKADLGVSMIAAPAFVVWEAAAQILPGLSVGVTEYIIQGLLLVILCLAVGRWNWRYLLAFAVAVLYGYVLDGFLWLISGVQLHSVWSRWVLLLVGDCVTALGVACFFRTYMPLQVYELFVAELADRFSWPIGKVKACFDVALLVVSVVLALTLFGDVAQFDWSTIGWKSFHSIGLGTLVTTVINSPIIGFMGKCIDRFLGTEPLFPRLQQLLKRN